MNFNEFLGLVMLFSMMGVIFIGFPISFTLLFLAFVSFGSIGLGPDQTFNLAYLQIWGTMKDDILPAVPLFIFMGFMTEQAGLMERLFLALRNLLAPVRARFPGRHPDRGDLRHGDRHRRRGCHRARHHGWSGHGQGGVRCQAVGGGDRRRRHARDPDPAERDAGSHGADHRRAGEPALLGRLRPGPPARRDYTVYCMVRSFFNPALGPPVPKEERVADAGCASKKS